MAVLRINQQNMMMMIVSFALLLCLNLLDPLCLNFTRFIIDLLHLFISCVHFYHHFDVWCWSWLAQAEIGSDNLRQKITSLILYNALALRQQICWWHFLPRSVWL